MVTVTVAKGTSSNIWKGPRPRETPGQMGAQGRFQTPLTVTVQREDEACVPGPDGTRAQAPSRHSHVTAGRALAPLCLFFLIC